MAKSMLKPISMDSSMFLALSIWLDIIFISFVSKLIIFPDLVEQFDEVFEFDLLLEGWVGCFNLPHDFFDVRPFEHGQLFVGLSGSHIWGLLDCRFGFVHSIF
jgi:hypothetical protein